MTDRIRLDDLTSDQLDQLYDQIEAAEDLAEQHARNTLTVARERESYRKAWKDEQQRRARAEGAITRAREVEEEWRKAFMTSSNPNPAGAHALAMVRAALDSEQPAPGTAATQATDGDGDPPVQCWHTEPGSPCDWNICRQPKETSSA